MIDHPFLESPDDPQEQRELQATYYGMLAEVDDQIGRVLDWLDATGQARPHARGPHAAITARRSATTTCCTSSAGSTRRTTCR